MAKPTCSLNISTYNWPAALRLVLQSVLLQKVLPDEVVINDDGSGPETKAVIDEFRTRAPFAVVHVWHEDKGFCLPGIQNKGIVGSTGDYIIQVDGDCLLHPLFVADHLSFAKPGTFVCGNRGMIDEEYTAKLLREGNLSFPLKPGKHLSNKFYTLHNRPLAWLQYWFQRGRKNYLYVKGCNMAFWKKDLLDVNGHNESFVGWGKEDNDIALRLLNNGRGIRFVKCVAIQYHLHHKESDRARTTISEALLKETEFKGLTVTPNGIVKG